MDNRVDVKLAEQPDSKGYDKQYRNYSKFNLQVIT